MQPLPLLAAAVVTACASSYVVVQLAAPASVEGAVPDGAAPMDARIAELQDANEALARRVAKLESDLTAPSRQPVAAGGVDDEQLRRVLEDMIASSELPMLQAAEEKASAGDFELLYARLSDPNLDWDSSEEVWKEIREAGLLDEMVARFEQLAAAQPGVADAQVAVGAAYLQKLFTVPDNEKGPLSMQADEAFDRALEIDSQHWEARFSKAVSLSFWPAFLGRGSEAMEHFQILIDQQEASGRSSPEFAESYLFLGNMYEQRGKMDEANEVWQRGYALHPDHAELKNRLKK